MSKSVKKYFAYVLATLIIISISSCSTMLPTQLGLMDNSCSQQPDYQYNKADLPLPLKDVNVDTALYQKFSESSLKIANSIHLLDFLTTYLSLRQLYQANPIVENRLNVLEMSNLISQKINTASLEVSSIASQIDCEKEKVAQIADYLKAKEAARETKLTVTAIAVGAVGTLIGAPFVGAKLTDNGLNYVTLAIAIAEASLGIMILINEKKISVQHPKNILKDIWEGKETSNMFPPFIWHYLNYYNPSIPGNNSLRYQLVERWLSFGQIQAVSSNKKQKFIDLNFGNGGIYTADQLYNRANMLEQLESVIKLIKQDLTHLSHEFESLKI